MRASLLLVGWLIGCGGSSSSDAPPNTTDATTDATDDGLTDTGGIVLDGEPDTGGKLGCSADLRSLVDATGKVVTTCPPDQGCSNGACVPACAAASDSRGNVGCDFRMATPLAYGTTLPPCFAVVLANTWPRPAKVTVERGGATYDVTKFGRIPINGKPAAEWAPIPEGGIPVDQVGVLFLSSDPASVFPENGVPMKCPVTPAIDASTMLEGSGKGVAFHVTSDTPVSAYDILPYGGARSHFPSAELLFPTTAWGENYVAIATPPGTHVPAGPLWAQVLATSADTEIKVLPSVDLPMSSVFSAAPKGATATFVLQAGEYLQWQLATGSNDVSGSIVLANKPVAVMTGNRFFRLQPSPAPGGESTHQQILPVRALSSEYVAAPYETRRKDLAPEEIPYRLVGAVDGTTLTFDPPIASAPTKLDRGEVADFKTKDAFRVTSQDPSHPFAAAQLMPTANVEGGTRPGATAPGTSPGVQQLLGDEEFVVMMPAGQFLSKYVFFTDPAYPTTNLAVTRVKTSSGFADVKLGCLGNLTGWKPVGTSGKYEVTTVDLVRAGVSVGSCTNGRHVAESAGPFGIVVWGLDTYSSYGYPAGGNAAALSTVTVEPKPK
ncbi:MAG: IgGFc-binding protein [Deltaproteobacteria bacterium]|nr:IgGFc-binding protein [Deltaproteobacteria bacterium]